MNSIRQHNIERGIISDEEREIFDKMTLHLYKHDRVTRGLQPLTTFQEAELTIERIADAITIDL